MSEMIERVAEAIHGYRDKPIPWDRCVPTYQVELRKQAKAAIEAMREPTKAIANAMLECEDGERTVQEAWSYLIDVALKE